MTSCSVTEGKRLDTAATIIGQTRARNTIARYPADCRKQEAHAPLGLGSDKITIIVLERKALNRANARVVRCADFHDRTVSAVENLGEK